MARTHQTQARNRIGKKIKILRKEGVDQDQAVAEALSMNRAGRLTKSGGYRRVRRKARRAS